MLTNFGIGTLAAVLARRLGAGIHLAGWRFGRLAQLVERLLYTQNVGGSSPSPPTMLRPNGLRVAQRGEGCRAEALRRGGLLRRFLANEMPIKENARRHRNSLRQHAGGERRQTGVCRSAEEGNQIASLSSFEARNATFLLALI